jgi:hypothetical protein
MKFLIVLISLASVSFSVAAEKLPPGHPPVNMEKPKVMMVDPAQLPQKAKVLEVIDVSQYTYLQVKQGEQTLWLAGPSLEVKKDDIVRFENGAEMKNFHSNTLDRTFPSIFFVNTIVVSDEKE